MDNCSIHGTHSKHLIVPLAVADVVLDHRPLEYTSVRVGSKKKALSLYSPVVERIKRNTSTLNSDIVHTSRSSSV